MNTNDLLCTGAKPLYFLDYLATGKLNLKTMKDVFKGIVEGCHQSDCAIIGGETAEMPDMYKGEDYDLAGFAVGIVEESKMIDGSNIKSGDIVIGLPSSGLHSNGYSLARKALGTAGLKKHAKIVIEPTRIYVKPVLALLKKFKVKGMAHMTGGAWYEKLTKILPQGHAFEIQKGSWPIPQIFTVIQEQGNVPEADMFLTFNMGIGFSIVVSPKDVAGVQVFLKKQKVESYIIGQVIKDNKNKVIFK